MLKITPPPYSLIFDDTCSFCRFLAELGRKKTKSTQIVFFPQSKARIIFGHLSLPFGKIIFLKNLSGPIEVFTDELAWKEVVEIFVQLNSLHWIVKKILGSKQAPNIFGKIRSLCLHCRRIFA